MVCAQVLIHVGYAERIDRASSDKPVHNHCPQCHRVLLALFHRIDHGVRYGFPCGVFYSSMILCCESQTFVYISLARVATLVHRVQENLEVLSSLSTSDKLDLKGSKSIMCTDEAMQEYEDDPDCKNIECQQMNRCGGVSQFLTDFCIFLVFIMALVSFATVSRLHGQTVFLLCVAPPLTFGTMSAGT
jgi:hypothetical protein